MINTIIGFLTGVVASMGLGGGFILLIYLTVVTDVEQIAAQSINIIFFLPIALISILIHAKNKLIEWKVVSKFAITGIMGVVFGTFLSKNIDSYILIKLFAVLLFIVGFKEMFHKKKNE